MAAMHTSLTSRTQHARDDDLEARIAWSHMAEPGDRLVSTLIRGVGAVEALRLVKDMCLDDIVTSLTAPQAVERPDAKESAALNATLASSLDTWRARHQPDAVQRDLDLAHEAGLIGLIPGDLLWPTSLDGLDEMDTFSPASPTMLWVRGEASLPSSQSIAITGARACTSYGDAVTREIAEHVASRRVTVLSGAAYGVDGVAHSATLVSGGSTVAVLACGPDRFYPAGHSELLDRVAARGAVVCELPPGATPTKHRFAARSRLIAALSGAVVVTEAGYRSSSLQVAELARGMGRPVGAVPGPVTSAASAGCHQLIRTHTARLIANGDDALSMLGVDRNRDIQFETLTGETS